MTVQVEALTYEALKAKCDALADKCDRLEYNLGNAIVGEQEALQRVNALDRQLSMSEAKCKGYFSDAAAALVKCDALAVENAAMRAAIDDIADTLETGTDGMLFTAVDNAVNLEVTQTDAALAAIQAQGVEKFAAWASQQEVMAAKDGDQKEAGIYRQVEARAKHFATELREAK
ncbi:hypothetical protein FOT55_15015 [Serratia bockelmannii]|uniref:hypothetical protein n=1 Tax=Serratia bockelmannii TaxID=2703793 RepID=UPI0011C70124|nr:hypothetical protein [Serratia bockelmannii]TXE47860.1 hypothetical protein FOT55_15015 [Serratia bockelmannii]